MKQIKIGNAWDTKERVPCFFTSFSTNNLTYNNENEVTKIE